MLGTFAGQTMRATSDDVKEIYARFGLAYYHAEVLHRGLCNLYALSRIPEEGGITGPRLEEHLTEAYSSTLGRIVTLIVPLLPDDLVPKLQLAVDRRNFLAHHFWFERIRLTTTSEGAAQLVEELSTYSETFQALDAEIEHCTELYLLRTGITDETFVQALRATLRGEDTKPIVRQRRPKREELIVAIYQAPTGTGGSTLIFQAEDGVFWQLCDAGLGWTAYDQIEPDWEPAEVLQEFLPVRINPRPPVDKPWYFDIPLGRGASLVVRPGPAKNQFRCRIRRKSA
jgi:hypothetical protein